MKIHPAAQGSVEWCEARAGIPTASEFDNLVTPLWEIRKGKMPESYLAEKVAEAWQGCALVKYNTFDMDIGKLLEDEAIPWYEIAYERKVDRVGLCLTDDMRIGCSPDGLIGTDSGIEVKCPEPHTHVKYLLGGEVPAEYRAQVQGGMLVTERPEWKFMSYRRHFPKLVLTVERDDKAQAALGEALEIFLDKFNRAMRRLEEINGGPPQRRRPAAPIVQPEANYEGVTP